MEQEPGIHYYFQHIQHEYKQVLVAFLQRTDALILHLRYV